MIDEDVNNSTFGWSKAITDKMHSVYSKRDNDNPVVLVKVYAKLPNVNLDLLFSLILDCDERKKWDKIIKELYISEKIDEYSDVIYCVIKTPPGFSNRDYVQYRYHLHNKKNPILIEKHQLPNKTENDYYALYLKSVVKENLPEVKGLVRAETIITGYLIEQEGNDVNFTMVLQTDVKGNIPKSIFNRFSTRVPGMWLKNLMNGYEEKMGEM